MAVTIKDVAKEAGVSKATVSRVLNNSPLITPETTEKVKKAMRNLQYFPNHMARSFASQNTYTIALIVDIDNPKAFGNPFFYQLQYGIEKALCSRGYYLMIANANMMDDHDFILNKLVLEKRVDGIIFPASLLQKTLVKKMEEQNFPFVVIGEPDDDFDVNWVDIDNKMAGDIATKHLIDNGYKNIAFVVGNLRDKFNQRRLEGYIESLKKHNIEFHKDLVSEKEGTIKEGYNVIERYIHNDNRPDAVIFTNNIAAFGALSALKDNGYKIPEEFGLVSFDNYPVAELSEPNITTVDIDVIGLGVQAATMLLKEIEMPSESNQRSLLSAKLIIRGTSTKAKTKEVIN